MTTPSLDALFQQARPPARSLEIDAVVGALHERFGSGSLPPVSIGRYRVAGRLGAGGLGIVYRAFDPVLARYVAIKVLKGGREAAEHDVRLLREAQVLARIRHPRVVEVFDVGFFDDHEGSRFFVAMELVEGTDLREWLARGRSLAEIRTAFVAAAEGLAGAHAVGLLHRDFKPGNVLMGNDGAVKVADFGLAAMTQELRAEADTTAWSVAEGNATLSWRPGGTLPYMSPEQQRGEPLAPACDQFGFCVSLYEAVYGRRPFEGRDRDELLAAKLRGPALPREPLAPAALRRLLAQGLSPRAEDRFADMHALRQALLRVPTSRRSPWLAVAGLVLVGTTLVAVTADFDDELAAPACPSPPASLQTATTTTPAVATVLAGSPPLTQAWPEMVEALDAYAAELRRRWDGACGLDDAGRERTQRCLTQCGDALTALQALLAEGERETLAQGWSLVQALPDVNGCVPEVVERRTGEANAALGRSRMLAAAGRLVAAREVLDTLRAELAVQADTLARRDVDIELAEIASLEGEHEQAKQSLELLYFEAVGEGDAVGASRAAVWLAAQGYRTGDVDAALQWSRAAHTRLEHVQPRNYEIETMAWHNLALAHLAAGDLEQSLGTIREAVERASAPGVPPSLRRATLQVQAELLMLNGRPSEALAIHRDLLHTDQSPPQRDPLSAVIDLQSLGNVRMTLHDVDGAWTAYRDALDTGRSVLGPEHPDTAAACISYAWVEGDRGQPVHGQEILAPCLQRLVESLGEEHPHVALARAMQGRLASQAGQHDEARRLLEASLASLERSVGESHYAVGDVLHELGLALAATGDATAARTMLERALRVRQTALPPGHVSEAETRAELSRLLLVPGLGAVERDAAREHLVRAVATFEARGLQPAYVETWRERLRALDTTEQAP
jgi:serine/threonine protein kinase/tetratricopeptide (TPR) repeat protein